MKNNILPLEELSIARLYNGDKATYEVPIYQRNYAWEKDEIAALIQDVYDALAKDPKSTYFIGTLVSFHKGDNVYEIIDGQQRLTTINLILGALCVPIQNKLTYRARKKSNKTIGSLWSEAGKTAQNIAKMEAEDKDLGIINGYKYAKAAIAEIVLDNKEEFVKYFQHNVHIIHYEVPKDIDLNHYFEVMNSRGEQLEKHEIIKARMLGLLEDEDRATFNRLWEICSEMNVYAQQKYRLIEVSEKTNDAAKIYGKSYGSFEVFSFDEIPKVKGNAGTIKISELIGRKSVEAPKDEEKIDSFQSIIDFANFLLIVLKLTRMDEEGFDPTAFNLDDKELIREFGAAFKKHPSASARTEFVKKFGHNLLMAKYLLDNYIVHHAGEDDKIENNPWKLQYWQMKKDKRGILRGYPDNLYEENAMQDKMVHLLSMFEVSFTARQRKNYLFYCLLYLFRDDDWDLNNYCRFASNLADKYFYDVYLVRENLNDINTPMPGSFDRCVLEDNKIDTFLTNDDWDFTGIYGDGENLSKGIPLFIFNYLDYKLWAKYADELRGEKTKKGDSTRRAFFDDLGCSDFELKIFEQFYFSRTRRSLEHFYPQAMQREFQKLTEAEINCFGNFAMIGSEANSSGSNWSPKSKLDHYLDSSGKIKLVSVASIKFMIMMQICKDNQYSRQGREWIYEDIEAHQEKMLRILLDE